MKTTRAITFVAICSMMLAGCWYYSRPTDDPMAGCQKTSYGIAIASTSSTACPPDNSPPLPKP
jgi:hypothetical protein